MLIELDPNNLPKLKRLLSSGEYSGCTLINKVASPNITEIIQLVQIEFPNLSIIPTFSLKVNYNSSSQNCMTSLVSLCNNLPKSIKEVLIVSGNPKRALTTSGALSDIQNLIPNNQINFGVAYNPYSKSLDIEKLSLESKLSSGIVKTIYFQLGGDLELLENGISHVKTNYPNTPIVGSVLSPSKNILRNLKLRPWHGVFYSDEYYNNLELAINNSQAQQSILMSNGCQILLSCKE